MYENPKKFFIRFLLLTLITFINILLLVLFSSGGTVGLVIALVLSIINAVLLLYMFVIALINLIKKIFSEDKSNLGFHFINFVFSLVITVLFGLFYVVLVFGAMVVLLPFLAK